MAIARYSTTDVTLTSTPPSELRRALPDLPKLAGELSERIDAATGSHHRNSRGPSAEGGHLVLGETSSVAAISSGLVVCMSRTTSAASLSVGTHRRADE